MKPAEISFKNSIAYSKNFNDIYFSDDDPVGESQYVFCSGLDEISHLSVKIFEAGFGSGLNFLLCAKRFLGTNRRLDFVSVEANPICAQDLARIYEILGVKDDVADSFLAKYPPLTNGFHRINLAPNITLTLCFYDILTALDELSFKADLIFLDGFAPSKNKQMWSDEVIAKVAKISAQNAILRTYTAASAVQKVLKKFGFEINLAKGHGRKREMIVGRFVGKMPMQTHEQTAYFSRFFSDYSQADLISGDRSLPPKTALVIGGGVAGCVAAFKLKQLGVEVAIAEKMDELATNGSGNLCGILMPLITKPDVKLGKMHINAFLQAVRFYAENLSQDEIEICSVSDYAYEIKLQERLLKWLEFDEQNGIFTVDLDSKPYPKAQIKKAAKAYPRKLCNALCKDITKLFGYEFSDFENLPNGSIRANFKNDKSLQSDILILALGSESMEFFRDFSIQLSSVRGQVTHIKPNFSGEPLSARGYICQAQGVQLVGATYDRNLFLPTSRQSDNEKNLDHVSEFLPKKPEIIGSKVGFRGYSSDRFALIGRLYDEEFYKNSYKALLWSKSKPQPEPKYIPNVYVSTAHGSRGLGTAVLGAELICDLIFDRPLCLEKSLFDELHLARFLIRRLKKGLEI